MLEATLVKQKGTMAHIWPEIHTVTTFYRVDVASGDVEMNDEHSDYRWITGDLHPFVGEMITRSEIFQEVHRRIRPWLKVIPVSPSERPLCNLQ